MTADGGLKGPDVDQILLRGRDAEVPERLVVRHDADGLYYGGLRSAAARCLEDDALKPLLGMRVVVDARSSVGQGYIHFLDALGVEMGAYTHRANSFHCYERDFAMLDGYCARIRAGEVDCERDDLTFSYADDWAEQMEEARPEIAAKVDALKMGSSER